MRTKVTGILILLIVALVMVFSTSALAVVDCNTCSGKSDLTTSEAIQCGTNCATNSQQTPGQATTNLHDTTSNIIEVLSIAVGVITVIMIMIGGFRYVTSGGKQESVTGAKNTILYAVAGLVIVAIAQLIVHFVLGKTTSVLK